MLQLDSVVTRHKRSYWTLHSRAGKGCLRRNRGGAKPLPSRGYWQRVRRCPLALHCARPAPLPIAASTPFPLPNVKCTLCGEVQTL